MKDGEQKEANSDKGSESDERQWGWKIKQRQGEKKREKRGREKV